MTIFRIVEADVVGATRKHLLNAWTHPALGAAAAIVLAAGLWLALPFGGRSGDPTVLAWCAVATFILLLIYGVSAPISARRQLTELASLGRPLTFTWTPLRLRATSEVGSADMPWSDLWAWSRYRGGYLLYLSSRLHYIVPDRAFGSDAPEDMLRDALVSARVPERRPFR